MKTKTIVMKTKIIALVTSVAMAAALILSACQQMQTGPKEGIGAVSGAVLGGYFGSKVGGGEGRLWATGAAAVLGALMGSSVGKSLDDMDRIMMERTTQASLEHTQTGSTSKWQNPDTGHSGTVIPTKTYQKPNGPYCREYSQTVTIDGRSEQAHGTACRQPDGTWKISN